MWVYIILKAVGILSVGYVVFGKETESLKLPLMKETEHSSSTKAMRKNDETSKGQWMNTDHSKIESEGDTDGTLTETEVILPVIISYTLWR